MEYQELWNKVRDELEKSIAPATFEETFGEVKKVAKAENGVIFVLCPSLYIKRKINTTYYKGIDDTLKKISNKNLKFTFICNDELKPLKKENTKESTKIAIDNYLNPNFTFESFVVVESNKMAYLAALLLVDSENITITSPNKSNIVLNPFYIFGGVGLGKTHLMQAIGNYIANKNVDNKIVYVTASEFLDDYTKAVYEKNMQDFDNKYKNMLVLTEGWSVLSTPTSVPSMLILAVFLGCCHAWTASILLYSACVPTKRIFITPPTKMTTATMRKLLPPMSKTYLPFFT